MGFGYQWRLDFVGPLNIATYLIRFGYDQTFFEVGIVDAIVKS
jgi:hypothetical protein